MTHEEAEALARTRLGNLAERDDPGGNRDWHALAVAARAALAGDRGAAATFRRVFEEPGFAISNSCMEVGYAALGLALTGDRAAVPWLARCEMRINGNGEAIDAALVLLGEGAR